jgi:hypothetical protein
LQLQLGFEVPDQALLVQIKALCNLLIKVR